MKSTCSPTKFVVSADINPAPVGSCDDDVSHSPVLHKSFNSTPDLKDQDPLSPNSFKASLQRPANKHQDEVNTLNQKNQRNTRKGSVDENGPASISAFSCNSVDKQRGYFTLPSRAKQAARSRSHDNPYRVPSEIRPILVTSSSETASLQTSLPPPDHPPPPPPVAQLVPVDTSKKNSSDYATVNGKSSSSSSSSSPSPVVKDGGGGEGSPNGGVKSSFKPSDDAKLYASPETMQQVAFVKKPPEEVSPKQQQEPQHPRESSPQKTPATQLSPKKKSPTRANSMPARPTRPQVLRRSMIVDTDSSAASSETYSVNGVSYTTYTTFRSPITPDEVPEAVIIPPFDPSNHSTEPSIPEPDYDLTDEDDAAEACERASKKTLGKKKKSVSFAMNEEDAARLQASSKTKKPESILKDSSREKSACQHERPTLSLVQNPLPLSGDKYKVDRIPQAKLKLADPPAAHGIKHNSEAVSKTVRIAESDKIRISIGAAEERRASLTRSHSVATTTAASNGHCHSSMPSGNSVSRQQLLQKSQSFSADKKLALGQSGNNGTTNVSENDLRRARSQLKPSRSFPNELSLEEGDNSSSGVSSDQEVNNGDNKYVTYLPVEAPPSDTSDSSEKSWVLRAEQDSLGRNLVTMKQMLHPKLQAIFDAKPGSPAASSTLPSGGIRMAGASSTSGGMAGPGVRLVDFDHDSTMSSMSSNSSSGSSQQQHYNSQTLPSRGHLIKHAAGNSGGGSSNADERSIAESLALIQQHVNSLGEVNNLVAAGGSGSTSSGSASASDPAVVLAPPPGFSDPESQSDDSLSAGNIGKRRFGFGKLSQGTRNYSPQSLTEQLRAERRHQQQQQQQHLMSRSMDSAQFDFRMKPLMGWTGSDVSEWLDSLLLTEHKTAFTLHKVDGLRLAGITRAELESLGVVKPAQMLTIEKSLKRYATK